MKILVNEKLSEHRYKTPEGYLICTDAILARTGKQEYKRSEVFGDECKNPDDPIFVDRTVNEVFSDEALASFENKAVTVEHPDENIDAHNHNRYSVGFVRDVKRANVDGQDVMTGTLVITDAKAIEEIENGEHTDLSCGYDCDILDEENPRQRHIRGNHVALCAQGRAGIARIVDSTNNTEYERQTKQGFPIVARYKDGGRLHVIAKRSYDYIVCLGYDERTGTWSQGRYDNSTLGRAIDTLITEKPNAIRISDSMQNTKTFKVECEIDDTTHVYNIRANSINDAIRQIKDLQNFTMTEQEAKTIMNILKEHYEEVYHDAWLPNDIYIVGRHEGYSIGSNKVDLTKFKKWLSDYVVTQHMIFKK